jgi:hypothetical protein
MNLGQKSTKIQTFQIQTAKKDIPTKRITLKNQGLF